MLATTRRSAGTASSGLPFVCITSWSVVVAIASPYGGKVHRERRIGLEPALAHVADDADDLARGARPGPSRESRSGRSDSGPARAGRRARLLMIDAPRLADHVLLGEVASGEQRQSHRLEIVLRDDAPRRPRHGGVGHVGSIGGGDAQAGAAARERPAADRGDDTTSGSAVETRSRMSVTICRQPRLAVRARDADRRRSAVFGLESAIDRSAPAAGCARAVRRRRAASATARLRRRRTGRATRSLAPIADGAALALSQRRQRSDRPARGSPARGRSRRRRAASRRRRTRTPSRSARLRSRRGMPPGSTAVQDPQHAERDEPDRAPAPRR